MRRRTFVPNTDRTTRIIGLLLITAAVGACSGTPNTSRSLTGGTILSPSPAPVPTPVPPSKGFPTQIIGYLLDSAWRPLKGAAIVTVLDGPAAGTSVIPDANGRFLLEGAFEPSTTFRAEAEGHVAEVRTWNCSRPPCADGAVQAWIGFYLAPLEPSVDMAGEYTLTFDADSACTDLPEAVRTRNYAVTIAASPTYGTTFRATLAGAPFFSQLRSFEIGVAGSDVTFSLNGGDSAAVVEQLDAATYLAFSGMTATVNATRDISTRFDGWIEYCVTRAPIDNQYYYCGYADHPLPSFVSTRVTCASRNHQLTLRRRD